MIISNNQKYSINRPIILVFALKSITVKVNNALSQSLPFISFGFAIIASDINLDFVIFKCHSIKGKNLLIIKKHINRSSLSIYCRKIVPFSNLFSIIFTFLLSFIVNALSSTKNERSNKFRFNLILMYLDH